MSLCFCNISCKKFKFQHSKESDEFLLSDQSHELRIKTHNFRDHFCVNHMAMKLFITNYEMPVCFSLRGHTLCGLHN
jgi:hypothetical protein